MGTPELRTERLLLRGWRDDDLEPFAAINADPEVRRYFPTVLERAESDAQAALIRAGFATHGFGLWAVELPGQAAFIGFVGLAVPKFDAHFTPCVEIAWRLARAYQGHGYATEGARAAMDFGFTHVGLAEIVSFTVPANRASRRVMEKLGMQYAGDFDHPLLSADDPLQRHVLYRLSQSAWSGAR
jgi:RimJ/RimL family protein N-acetyltransferase